MDLIRTNPRDIHYQLFEKLPELLFPANEIRKIQVDQVNKEFINTCFLLSENNQYKARAATYQNPNLIYKNEKVFGIGNYECVKDEKYSQYLLESIFEEARKLNYKYIIGPINGSTWNNYRFKISNTYPPFFLEPEHPVYYNDQFINAGFKIISEYTSYLIPDLTQMPPFDSQIEEKLKKQKLTIRNIDQNNYEEELKKIYNLSRESFTENIFYSPIKWESFVDKYKPLRPFANPAHTLIAENKHGETVGFLFSIDDLFCKTEKRLIIKTLVRKKSPDYEGLGSALLYKIGEYAKQNNYKSFLHAFMISGSTFDVFSSKIGQLYRKYNLYIKEI